MASSDIEPASDLLKSAGSFFSLTPEHVLDAVEQSGRHTTGRCYALNSYENRVYDVELDEGVRVVAKFYRPGRWSRDAILDEHRLLLALQRDEIPVCAPIAFADGDTLRASVDGIWFALFPRAGGRSPDELTLQEYAELGRLLGRIHNVCGRVAVDHRPDLSPETYGVGCLETILTHASLPAATHVRYRDAVERVVAISRLRFADIRLQPIHADCHRGNLLRGREGWFFLDFDDMARGPAVQDFWLLLPARHPDCADELAWLVNGYEQFRAFDVASLPLIEVLRTLRYIRYAAWIAARWSDPAFPRAFPNFGSERYWEDQIADLYEQLRLLES